MARIAVVKAGSQKGDFGAKDGMVVCCLSADEPLSDHMKRVYANVLIDDNQLPAIQAAMEPAERRRAQGYLDLEELAAQLGDPSLVGKWRGHDVVPIQNGLEITFQFRTTDGVEWDDIDLNAVSSGTYTVGPTKQYSTWGAALDDIDTVSGLTGNLSFMQDASITAESGTGSRPQFDFNGYTLTFGNNSPHSGDPTQGHVTTCSSTPAYMIAAEQNWDDAGSGGVCVVRDLNIRFTGSGGMGSGNPCMNFAIRDGIVIRDCIIDQDTVYGCAGIAQEFPYGATGSSYAHIWNCEVSNIQGIGININSQDYTALAYVENCTVFGCGTGFHCQSQPATLTNNVAWGCTTAFAGIDATASGGCNGYNNASDGTTNQDSAWGGTGSGNLINQTLPGVEFVSTSISSSDYLKVTSAGVLDTGGASVNIAANTAGIRGDARPGTDTSYSIGADELSPIVNPTVTSCTPNDGAAAGGTPVTVGGTGFAAGATVTFGGASATSVVVVGPTSITCVTPAGSGVVDVKVTNTDTGNGTLVAGFSYIGVAEQGATVPVVVPARLGEGDAGIFRSSPGLGDVLNKIAVCLQFIQTASQEGTFAEFKTAMEDLVPPTYEPRSRYVTPYPAPDPEPMNIPRRTGEGRVGLNRAQTSEMGVGLKEVIDRISLMITEIQESSQLADFAAFKAALASLPELNKSVDSRV